MLMDNVWLCVGQYQFDIQVHAWPLRHAAHGQLQSPLRATHHNCVCKSRVDMVQIYHPSVLEMPQLNPMDVPVGAATHKR